MLCLSLEAIEERARSELGMIGEGESFYRVVMTDKESDDESKELDNELDGKERGLEE